MEDKRREEEGFRGRRRKITQRINKVRKRKEGQAGGQARRQGDEKC